MDVDGGAVTADLPSDIVPPSQRIPPEIIVKIIHVLVPTQTDHGPWIQKRLDALLKATSICRYWRYAALDHATLWSVVPIDRRSLGEAFLQRSRNVSLLITFEVSTRRCSPAHKAIVSLLPHIGRVKRVQFHAPAPVLNQIFSSFNMYTSGAQLEEIKIRVDGSPNGEKSRVALALLLENASTLKVLRLGVLNCHFPVQKLRRFSHLAQLELLSIHDFREVSSLLTSIPTLTSIKVRVSGSKKYGEDRRVIPQASLLNIHLQIIDDSPDLVLSALKIPGGVHLECEMLAYINTVEANRFLPLTSEDFENISQIEELRISPPTSHFMSITSYSGSGPTGSFCIMGVFENGYHLPIEDLSHLRKLVVEGSINLPSLEDIVTSAPQLVSVTLADCVVIRSPITYRRLGAPLSPVGAGCLVKAISEERRIGASAWSSECVLVNGTLEGELLEEFISLVPNRDKVGKNNRSTFL
jgi:hypothetical protein